VAQRFGLASESSGASVFFLHCHAAGMQAMPGVEHSGCVPVATMQTWQLSLISRHVGLAETNSFKRLRDAS
jgi:hypothetical protein